MNEPEEVRKVVKRYYKTLYEKVNREAREETQREFFDCINKSLNNDEQKTCEGHITRAELLQALKESGNNKSPGIDGIPVDFYKVFWLDISYLLVEVLNYAYDKGTLSVNQRLGVISLIPKKDKDTLYVKNWRPITIVLCELQACFKSDS